MSLGAVCVSTPSWQPGLVRLPVILEACGHHTAGSEQGGAQAMDRDVTSPSLRGSFGRTDLSVGTEVIKAISKLPRWELPVSLAPKEHSLSFPLTHPTLSICPIACEVKGPDEVPAPGGCTD